MEVAFMGRKNNRLQQTQDKNFQKFIDDFNKGKKSTSPKRNKHNDISQYEKQRSNPRKFHKHYSIKERIEYVCNQFDMNNIKYEVLNSETGIIGVYSLDNNMYVFVASTGEIKGVSDETGIRGVRNVITFLKGK